MVFHRMKVSTMTANVANQMKEMLEKLPRHFFGSSTIVDGLEDIFGALPKCELRGMLKHSHCKSVLKKRCVCRMH